jgi:uncharacterized membrane protein YeaQ/YmgE (transglycosylase-associated protein family)
MPLRKERKMLHIISMLVVGLITGALARFFLPGKDPMGMLMTALLGIAGSFVGGLISSLIWPTEGGTHLHPAGIILSIIGAILLLLLWRTIHPRAV